MLSFGIWIFNSGIPRAILHEPSVEQLLARGAIEAVLLFLPLAIMGIVIDRFIGWRITTLITALHKREPLTIGLYYLSFLVISMVLLVLSWLLPYWVLPDIEGWYRMQSSSVVKAIRLSEKNNSIGKYEGLFFLTKKGNNLVFTDGRRRPTIYILNEDEVKELVLGSALQ